MNFIQLDSQKVAMIGEVYSLLFSQQQVTKKKKGERILEQRSAQRSADKSQQQLAKILAHLKANISSLTNKQQAVEEKVCKILKHFIDRDEGRANSQMQELSGEIKTTMHVFINCYFYQTIRLDNNYNLPLGRYFNAVIKSQTAIDEIQEEFNNLPSAQCDYFYPIHCQVIRLKQQSNKFQKFKAAKSQKQTINPKKTESILETYQNNRAIQERDSQLFKMEKIKSILFGMGQLQQKIAQQRKYRQLSKSIQELSQDFRLSLSKIYQNLMEHSSKQNHEQAPSKTLFSEMKNQNSSLKKHKQYMDQENQKLKNRIMELQNNINSSSHEIYEKTSKKEEELRLKISRLEESEKILKKQGKQYEDKLQQNKVLSAKINQLNHAIIEKQEAHERDNEEVGQNLKLAKHSLRILSEEKEQQKQEYSKLQQRNTQLSQEMAELRKQIIALKQQAVAHLSQPAQPEDSKEEIITKLRANEKIQKKNHDRLTELFEKQRAQRRESDLAASKLRESNQASETTIRTLKEDIQKYETRLQQCQGNTELAKNR